MANFSLLIFDFIDKVWVNNKENWKTKNRLITQTVNIILKLWHTITFPPERENGDDDA